MINVVIKKHNGTDKCSLCEKNPALIETTFEQPKFQVIKLLRPVNISPATLYSYRACGACLLSHGKQYQTILLGMQDPTPPQEM